MEGINSRLGETKKRISNIEERIMEATQSEEQKKKKTY